MYCNKCGKEIPEDSRFCPYCGNGIQVRDDVVITVSKKTTFKDAVKALFSRIFVFEGRTSQREFNFGLLFIILVSMALSMIMTFPEASKLTEDLLASNGNTEEVMNHFVDSMVSKDIFHFSNLYNIGVAILYSTFFIAPVYRRMIDSGKGKKFAMGAAILFVVSEIMCCNLLYCLLPDNVYQGVYFIIEIFSIVNLVILLMCIFGKSREVEID